MAIFGISKVPYKVLFLLFKNDCYLVLSPDERNLCKTDHSVKGKLWASNLGNVPLTCEFVQFSAAQLGCQTNVTGVFGWCYQGTVSWTVTGRTCQQWSMNYPHDHSYTNLPANYCRNPTPDFEPGIKSTFSLLRIKNLSKGVWCYTTDPDKRWELCPVSICWLSSDVFYLLE